MSVEVKNNVNRLNVILQTNYLVNRSFLLRMTEASANNRWWTVPDDCWKILGTGLSWVWGRFEGGTLTWICIFRFLASLFFTSSSSLSWKQKLCNHSLKTRSWWWFGRINYNPAKWSQSSGTWSNNVWETLIYYSTRTQVDNLCFLLLRDHLRYLRYRLSSLFAEQRLRSWEITIRV